MYKSRRIVNNGIPSPWNSKRKEKTTTNNVIPTSESFHSANSQRRPSSTTSSTDGSFHSLAPSRSNASTVDTVILRPDHLDTSLAPCSTTTFSDGRSRDDNGLDDDDSAVSSTASGFRMGYQSGLVPDWPLGASEPSKPAPLGFSYGDQTGTTATTATTATATTATVSNDRVSAGSGFTHAPEPYYPVSQATDTQFPQEERSSMSHSGLVLVPSVDTTRTLATTTSIGSTVPNSQRESSRIIRLPVSPDTPPTTHKGKMRNCFNDCFNGQS